MTLDEFKRDCYYRWRNDWNAFAYEGFGVVLDPQQQEILYAIQTEKMVAVASGTARGKDYLAAMAALCFFYLTPKFDPKTGALLENTKVALTAPTGRQIGNIMYPELTRMYRANRVGLHGRLVSFDIRTKYPEWFLTGFKAEDNQIEVWSGFHAVNTMFIVTEASGLSETTFAAIEGNLQSNSKILIVFNPNSLIGYAARAMSSPRYKAFRLDDLNAPNVLEKRQIYPGQVDYEWVKDKVSAWCNPIQQTDFNEGLGDFKWEGLYYRPNDLFRVKVRGMFPEVSEDVLIPYSWIELANERWEEKKRNGMQLTGHRKIGVDIAGMGRDASVLCHRFEDTILKFDVHQSGGAADHMKVAGMIKNSLDTLAAAFIDTIGEGAGVYSRLLELGLERKVYSCKFSQSVEGLSDYTGQFAFANMKAYLYWAVRDWLNPAYNSDACVPPIKELIQEIIEIRYTIQSTGKIIIEPKEKLKERLGRSPDYFDSLANTFYPATKGQGMSLTDLSSIFH